MFNLFVLASLALSAADLTTFEKCYQQYGQVETVKEGGKKITTYKDSQEVAMECNKKIYKFSETVKDKEVFKNLLTIVGRNSNWANVMPIILNATKSFKKDFCEGADYYKGVLDMALAHPDDWDSVKDSKKFMETCWPNNKKLISKLLNEDTNGYTKGYLCDFFKSKNAVPQEAKDLCQG
jgi:hypothetical protein